MAIKKKQNPARMAKAILKDCTRIQPHQIRFVDPYLLGEWMRHLRKMHGKKQSWVAAEMNMSPSHLCDCERGYRKLSEKDLIRFIEICLAD